MRPPFWRNNSGTIEGSPAFDSRSRRQMTYLETALALFPLGAGAVFLLDRREMLQRD
jgi:hypothetical protein